MREPFLKIAKLETFANEFVCFVRVTADSGAIGWGQTSTYNADITAEVFHRQVARWALGADALDILGLIERIEEREHKFPGSYRCRALAGLDTALWDLRGRLEMKPVVELLGGRPKALRAYASSMQREITPEAEAARLGKLRDELGFDAFKWRIAAECGRDRDEWPGRTEAVVPTVARALGPRVAKLVDANSGYSPAKAIAVGRMLEDRGDLALRRALPLLAARTDQRGRRCAVDRRDRRRTGLGSRHLGADDRDARSGRGAARRDVHGRTFAHAAGGEDGRRRRPALHAAQRQPVAGHDVHDAPARRNPQRRQVSRTVDRGHGLLPWQQDLFLGSPYWVEEGCVRIPAEPGWGVEINPKWLDRAAYRVSALP